MRKGISPLVAAVLLIAVTMTLAGILAYWASSFVRVRTEEWERRMPAGECSFANFRIYRCKYNSSTEKISLILDNVEGVELDSLVLFMLYDNATIANKTMTGTLPARTIKAFEVTGISENFEKITIKTNCPDVTVSASAAECK